MDASPIGTLLGLLISDGEWRSTAGRMLTALLALAPDGATHQADWPKNPRALTEALKRIAPDLRAMGIDWQRPGRTGRERHHVIRSISKDAATTVTTVTTDPQVSAIGDGNDGSDGSATIERAALTGIARAVFGDDVADEYIQGTA